MQIKLPGNLLGITAVEQLRTHPLRGAIFENLVITRCQDHPQGQELRLTAPHDRRHIGGKRCTTYLAWSSVRISCRVPAKATFGTVKVKVKTAAGLSNTKLFRVRR